MSRPKKLKRKKKKEVKTKTCEDVTRENILAQRRFAAGINMGEKELYSERYIAAEALLLELSGMTWFRRLFCKRKIQKFLYERITKYNF